MRQNTTQPTAGSDRGLSIAITHVLAIGVTTILVALLLTGSSALLDTETDRSTEQSLETIGERLAGEVANVDAIADDAESVTLTAEHPRTVTGSRYTVELLPSGNCDGPLLTGDTDCLRLTSSDSDIVEYVPVKLDTDVDPDGSPVSGGVIEITYDGDDLSIEGEN